MVSASRAQDLRDQLTTLDLFFERDLTGKFTYQLKLRVVFRNETGCDIVVKKPRWSAKPDEVQVRPDWNSSVQVETAAGWQHNQWKGDDSQMEVKQNGAFRVWVGLNWAFSDIELRQRHENFKVGTLVLPVNINGHDVELEKKI